jgi:hypothetical protein
MDEKRWCIIAHSKETSGAPGILFNTNVLSTCNSTAIHKHTTYIFLLVQCYTPKPTQATFSIKNDATQATLTRHIKQKSRDHKWHGNARAKLCRETGNI